MRHIIVEGPDGAGKTGLVTDLMNHTGLPLHPRFVQSTGGPPADLDVKVMHDMNSPLYQGHPHIYDRHPLISEPVYGPIMRGELRGFFKLPSWVDRYRAKLRDRSLVVWCLPPWSEVAHNVLNPEIPQMDGVLDKDNLYEVYQAYLKLSKQWPGVVHDYTAGPLRRMGTITRIKLMIQEA